MPPELLHPSGLDTTVRNTVSKILKKTARRRSRARPRKVGYYSKIGCKGGKRTIQATFIDEQGQTFKATKEKVLVA